MLLCILFGISYLIFNVQQHACRQFLLYQITEPCSAIAPYLIKSAHSCAISIVTYHNNKIKNVSVHFNTFLNGSDPRGNAAILGYARNAEMKLQVSKPVEQLLN